MRKLLNNPWFVGVLALGALGLIAHTVWKSQPHYGGAAAQVATAAEPDDSDMAADEPNDAPPAGPLSVRDALAALVIPTVIVDPFQRHGVQLVAADTPAAIRTVEQTESILLSAIWRQAGVDLVLVNGHVLTVGDIIGQLTIESIDLDGMWVSHRNGRNFVNLGDTFTLVTPVREGVPPALALHER